MTPREDETAPALEEAVERDGLAIESHSEDVTEAQQREIGAASWRAADDESLLPAGATSSVVDEQPAPGVSDDQRLDEAHPDFDAQARVRLASQDVSVLALDAANTPSSEDDTTVSSAREAVQSAQAGSASPRMGAATRAMRVQNLTRAARSAVSDNLADLPSVDLESARHLDRSDYPTPAQRDEAATLGRW